MKDEENNDNIGGGKIIRTILNKQAKAEIENKDLKTQAIRNTLTLASSFMGKEYGFERKHTYEKKDTFETKNKDLFKKAKNTIIKNIGLVRQRLRDLSDNKHNSESVKVIQVGCQIIQELSKNSDLITYQVFNSANFYHIERLLSRYPLEILFLLDEILTYNQKLFTDNTYIINKLIEIYSGYYNQLFSNGIENIKTNSAVVLFTFNTFFANILKVKEKVDEQNMHLIIKIQEIFTENV